MGNNENAGQRQDVVEHIMSLVNDLSQHLQEFQKLTLDVKPRCGEITDKHLPSLFDAHGDCRRLAESGMTYAAQFAEKGMELGYLFASQGMELGYEFASKGEEVGPMANRILFMATQIGEMADRIGEMADRILFMADKIVEFGNRIVYVAQLIVYTEQLIVNVGVLMNDTFRIISDLILTLVALSTGNDTFLQQRVEYLQASQSLHLIYENMNLMLNNMHEFSLKMLENEDRQHQNELKVRELQIKLREETKRANECFCPCFCVDQVGEQPAGGAPDRKKGSKTDS